MTRARWIVVGTGFLTVAAAAGTVVAQRSNDKDGWRTALQPVTAHAQAAAQTAKPAAAAPDYNKVIDRFCVECHNDRSLKGNLSFAKFDIAKAGDHADVTERMIRKLQAGMMPPPGVDRPEPAVYASLITTLEA